MHAIGIGMSCGVDHRNAGAPCGSEQLPGRLQRLPGMLAAGARIAPGDFANRTIAALIDLVVEVDRQHRGTASDPDLTAIGFVDLDNLVIDDVLPTMILKITCHSSLLFHAYIASEVVVEGSIGRLSLYATWPIIG